MHTSWFVKHALYSKPFFGSAPVISAASGHDPIKDSLLTNTNAIDSPRIGVDVG